MDYPLIAALLSAFACLFMWMHLREQKRDRRMCRRVDAALARQHAAHREERDAALAEQRAALLHEMEAMKREVFEALTNQRNLEAGMREMQHSLRAPDESVLRPAREQRPADHLQALVAAPRSRRTADTADGPALSTDFRSSCTLQVDRHAFESRRSSASKHPVAPAEAAAQRTICRDDPRHAAEAGPRAVPRPSVESSHDQHARVDPMPTPVSGISRGGAARTRREARGSQSTAPVLPQSFPPETAGARGSRFYEEAGSAVMRAAHSEAARTRREARGSQSMAPVLPQSYPPETAGARGSRLYKEAGSAVMRAAARSEGEAPVTRRDHGVASGSARAADVPSRLTRSGSGPAFTTPADTPAQTSFSVPAPVLPVAAAAGAPRARRREEREVRTSTRDLKRQRQRAQEPQGAIRRSLHCSPTLSTGAQRHRHRAGGTSAAEAFFMRTWSVGKCFSWQPKSETEGRSSKSRRRRRRIDKTLKRSSYSRTGGASRRNAVLEDKTSAPTPFRPQVGPDAGGEAQAKPKRGAAAAGGGGGEVGSWFEQR